MSEFVAKRTAAFLRMLADELVPQGKLQELLTQLSERHRYGEWPSDFTTRELSMAASIGPTASEVDEFFEARVAMYKSGFEEACKRADSLGQYSLADTAKVDQLQRENYHLREAFKKLGVNPPEMPE